LNPVYRWLADRVITSGEAIRRLVIEAGVRPERAVAIPAGVDLAEFSGTVDGEAMRKKLGLSRPVIGSVAMFRGSKGHAPLLDAFAAVHARHPSARLLLVGDGIRRAWVEGLAKERGLADLLRAMDCFVLASTRTEGVPQSLLQAFAAGIPAVGSAIGGIPEVISDGETGTLVKPDDPAGLAAAIEAVIGHPAAAASRARAARKLVEERFSHVAAVSRLLALYDEVLAGATRKRP
jgi:glycosyltransferase involved in cell wall biosynthesis